MNTSENKPTIFIDVSHNRSKFHRPAFVDYKVDMV